MNIDLFGTAGNLYWYSHSGWQTGAKQWQTRSVAGQGGWEKYSAVFGTRSHTIYAIDTYGNLNWHRHEGWQDGAQQWAKWQVAGVGGWQSYSTVFAAGDNILYGVDAKGDLYWYRHDGWQDGSQAWTGRKLVGRGGWDTYTSVFAGGEGILYAIDAKGDLYWYRHDGWQDGTERWTERSRVQRGGWDAYVSVFGAGDGILYAIDAVGDLYWFRHDGWQDGSERWTERQRVGNGWLTFKTVFAVGNGLLYGVGVDSASWMSLIPPNQKLNQFSIPGTHDTGTWPLADTVMGVTNNAKCQALTLQQQLEAGIRFLDIRVTQEDNGGTPDFKICHAREDTGLWFSKDILPVCTKFLLDHPSETLILSFKDEYGSTDHFEENVRRYLTPENCIRDTTVSSLGAARGRIVLVRRYEFGQDGIPARTGWLDDDTFSIVLKETNQVTINCTLQVQDVYGFGFPDGILDDQKRAKIAKKWSLVEAHLNSAVAETSDRVWWINFASASGPPTLINPVDFAKGNWGVGGVNSAINDYLKTKPYGHFGTVMLDFPEAPNDCEVVRRLIMTNVKL